MSKILKNISGIPYETDTNDAFTTHPDIPDSVWRMRAWPKTPTNFEQDLLTKHYGKDFIPNCKKVLEIGCGVGRNARYFVEKTNAKYYGFDSSPTSLKYFKKMGYPEDRYYISLSMDKKIMNQEYDLIFSTYVLNHIGFDASTKIHDANSITQILWPKLKKGGFWFSYELHMGQNGWHPDRWFNESFQTKTKDPKGEEITTINPDVKLLSTNSCVLEGSENDPHHLYVIKKV